MSEVKYIEFSRSKRSKTGRTKIWQVLANAHIEMPYSLGEIRWHGAWWRYAFHPKSETFYEHECLRKIADFCEEQSCKQRKAWRKQ